MQESNSGETKTSDGSKSYAELYDIIVSSLEGQDNTATVVVPLKSSVENNSAVPVVALPGIEGTSSLMASLAIQLTSSVLCCQYLMEQQNSIEIIVDTLIQVSLSLCFKTKLIQLLPCQELCDVFKANSTFRFICHSFGSCIALRMAEKLEAQGKEGKIVFIDGSPATTRFMGRGLFDAESYLLVENNVLFAISANYLPPETLPKAKELLDLSKSYEEKVENLFGIWPEDKQRYRQYFPTYVKSVITRSYAFKMSEGTQKKINAQCLLCKAADSIAPEGVLSEDYGLSEFLEKPLQVAAFGGTHTTVLENPELAKCINEFLL